MKIYACVFGCSANVADYEIALGLLEKAGFEIVSDPKKADLNIIFSCTVKVPTLQRMIHKINELTKLGKPLVVGGCMPKTDREIIEKINPKASLIGPNSIEKIVDIVNTTLKGEKIVFLKDLKKAKLCLPRKRRNNIINIIPISTGCLSFCSYCSVRFARGSLFSYPLELIVEEAKQAVESGCKELWITSQDNACYGFDKGTNLAELLNEIVKVDGKFFIRVGMMNPLHIKSILNELIEAYKNKKIFKFLHLPVESGSNKVLKDMNRGYKVEDFKRIVKRFREEIEGLTLSTDVIVGYPTESETDFQKTLKLIKEIKPDIVNISKFGARKGTEAAKLEELPAKIVKRRSKIISELVREISFEKNKRWLNWSGEILIDEKGTKENTWIGRNFAYKPIVVYSKEKLLGSFVNVEVVEVKSNYLIGKFNV